MIPAGGGKMPDLRMPINACPGSGQSTGSVTGYFYKNGRVVNGVYVSAFAEDPNYRAFSEATMLLFMNAVLLGPAY